MGPIKLDFSGEGYNVMGDRECNEQCAGLGAAFPWAQSADGQGHTAVTDPSEVSVLQ